MPRQQAQVHAYGQPDDTIPIPYDIEETLSITITYGGRAGICQVQCPLYPEQWTWDAYKHIKALTHGIENAIYEGLMSQIALLIVGRQAEENPFFHLDNGPVTPHVEEKTILETLLRQYMKGSESLDNDGLAQQAHPDLLREVLERLRELNITPSSPASLTMPAWLAAQEQGQHHE